MPRGLQAWCANARAASLVSLDTEFERQRTYFAQLCLVQIAVADSVACIDPLAGLELEPLFDFLAAPSRTKIFHAGRQDLEVLHFAGGSLEAPLIDTQLAAALAGFAEQIGYADLVSQLLGVTLDKSQTRTNWQQRPLTEKQLHYAADDVRYLGAVHNELVLRLKTLGRLHWLQEDCAALNAPELIDPPPDRAWQRVKGLVGVHDRAFARGAALAHWREQCARENDLPRGWVLKDAEVVMLALQAPNDERALAAVITDQSALVRRSGEAILEVLQAAGNDAPPVRPQAPDAAMRQVVKQLGTKVRARALELGVGRKRVDDAPGNGTIRVRGGARTHRPRLARNGVG